MDCAKAAHNYRQFLETLSLDTLARLDTLAAANLHYRDPLNDAHGLEDAKTVMARVFRHVDAPRYIVTHVAVDGDTAFLRWKFTCRPRRFGKGHPWIVDGVSEVRFNDDGKIVEQVDYWDAGHYVYERIPVFGYVIRYLRKRLATVVH